MTAHKIKYICGMWYVLNDRAKQETMPTGELSSAPLDQYRQLVSGLSAHSLETPELSLSDRTLDGTCHLRGSTTSAGEVSREVNMDCLCIVRLGYNKDTLEYVCMCLIYSRVDDKLCYFECGKQSVRF